MISSKLLVLALCAALAAAASAQSCNGLTPGAKYRLQALSQIKDPAQIKEVDAAVLKWIKQDCKKALAWGSAPSIDTKSATYGIATPRPGVEFADLATWWDFASMDDLKECYANGLKSGNLAAVRGFIKKSTRVLYDLSTHKGNPGLTCASATGLAPATVRYMFNYVLADPKTCKKATELQSKIVSGKGSELRVRSADGCDVVDDPAAIYGAGIKKTADYGGLLDFKSAADMTKYLSNTNPDTTAVRAEIRALGSSVIALPSQSLPWVAPRLPRSPPRSPAVACCERPPVDTRDAGKEDRLVCLLVVRCLGGWLV